MKLIVGLGNPGRVYEATRHNIGFSVIKSLGLEYKAVFKRQSREFSQSAKVCINGQNVILAMPLTFMNLSGQSVVALLKKHKVELKDLLVVCDDLDLELGRLKLRPEGSSGGHRGLQSIIDCIGGNNFSRLRVGIGRPGTDKDASDYVLSRFHKNELKLVSDTIKNAAACCECWLSKNTEEVMNMFNKRSKANDKV